MKPDKKHKNLLKIFNFIKMYYLDFSVFIEFFIFFF